MRIKQVEYKPMNDFIRVKAKKPIKDLVTLTEMIRNDLPPRFKACDMYISLNIICKIVYSENRECWVISDTEYDYLVHESSNHVIESIVNSHSSGKFFENLLEKLDNIAVELSFVPTLGSRFIELQRSFEERCSQLAPARCDDTVNPKHL